MEAQKTLEKEPKHKVKFAWDAKIKPTGYRPIEHWTPEKRENKNPIHEA
jgi:hypothetical protein